MKVSRRAFLKSSGQALVSLPPATLLTQALMNRAFAEAANGSSLIDMNYLGICLFAAPARWMFDQVLLTSGSEQVTPNAMVKTKFTGTGSYSDAQYVTFDYKGIQLPYLWSTSVYNGAGQKRPLTELADHMIVFRGYGTGVDGHPANCIRQFSPIPGAGSITGTVADFSPRLLRAVQTPVGLSNLTNYNSVKGTGLTPLFLQGNMIKAALAPFDRRDDTQTLEKTRGRYSDYIERAQQLIKNLRRGELPGADALSIDRAAAIKSMQSGFEDLDASWNQLYNKYLNLITNTIKDRSVPGISDQSIPTPGDKSAKASLYLMQLGTFNCVPASGLDLRDLYNFVDCSNMARDFAIAEFLFTRGIGGGLEIGGLEPQNLRFNIARIGSQDIPGSPVRAAGFDHDQHTTGAMTLLYQNSCYFRGMAAAIAELIDRLKAANVFQKSFIHVASDFGRSPRDAGDGSDHGFDSMVASLFTGLNTQGPLVLGNILQAGSSGVYGPGVSGTYGFKSLTGVNGSDQMLTPTHVAASIINLMGLPKNPFSNSASPLIGLENGTLKSYATAKIRG